MNDDLVDRLARAVATAASRRVLLGAAAGLAGAGAGALGHGEAAASTARSQRCGQFCTAAFPAGPERERCAARSARGGGLCVEACVGQEACASPYGGCGGSALCFCATTTEGVGLCLDVELLERLGSECEACGSSDECGGGEACVHIRFKDWHERDYVTCGATCGPKVCVPLAAGCRGLKRESGPTGTVRVRWR